MKNSLLTFCDYTHEGHPHLYMLTYKTMKDKKVIYVCHTLESRCTNKNSYHDILLYVYIRKCETFLTLMHCRWK